MQKQTSLYIPKPCREDWNKMTPTQQGRFCSSCSKQVVDFSLMGDNQILNFLSKQPGKLCGRFDESQLQRPLAETKIKKKKSWWMAFTMPFTLLFAKTEAQQNTQLTGDTIYKTETMQGEIQPILLGKIAVCKPEKNTTITGKVVDENNVPIVYVSVIEKGTMHGTVTDSSGNFSLKMKAEDRFITLIVSYIGYETIEKEIDLNGKNIINIKMKIDAQALRGEVVVLSGLVAPTHIVRKSDTLISSIKRICDISAFKMYPNPVTNGDIIHLEIKQQGEYEWQLLDNQSALIDNGELNILSAKSTSSITIPSNISPGIYYMCLINQKTKKRSVEKFIIQ